LSETNSLALDNRDCASFGLYETFSKYIIYLFILQYYVKTNELNFANSNSYSKLPIRLLICMDGIELRYEYKNMLLYILSIYIVH
jgi:hypothetical protein